MDLFFSLMFGGFLGMFQVSSHISSHVQSNAAHVTSSITTTLHLSSSQHQGSSTHCSVSVTGGRTRKTGNCRSVNINQSGSSVHISNF